MKLLLIALLTVILVSSTVLSQVDAKSKDSKAKDAIIKSIGKAVEGKYSSIKLIQLSKSNVSGYVIAYNTTKATPPTPPPVPPTPTPTPTGTTSKVCIVGDLDGNKVTDMMKGCPYKIALGDLGYDSDLKWFKSLNFNKCVVGNHDAPEDGSTSIYKEALALCGEVWNLKIGKGMMLLGFNTNGDLQTQSTQAQQILSGSQLAGVKTIIILSHKPCYTNPNSHHPVESKVKAFCDSLTKAIPAGIKVIYIAGHNHVLSSTADNTKFISGGGGRSHYDCGTDSTWTFCDNKNYGFLELMIDNNNGNTATKFIK